MKYGFPEFRRDASNENVMKVYNIETTLDDVDHVITFPTEKTPRYYLSGL